MRKKLKLNAIRGKRSELRSSIDYEVLADNTNCINSKLINITEINNDILRTLPNTNIQNIQLSSNCNLTNDISNLNIPDHLLNENKCLKEKENKPFYIDAIENFPGNYHTYVTKSLKSVTYLNNILNSEDLNSKYLGYINSKKVTLGKSSSSINKKTLILDLDETLIHSDFNYNFKKHDEYLYFKTDLIDNIQIPLILRPGVKSFLENISKEYEIVVFTASKKEYANVILDFLDPENKIFSHRLYRESCIPLFGKIFIKDLRIISDRNQSDMVIVDNSIYSFTNQISNGVLITSFFSDSNDKELGNLENYLLNTLSKSNDVRVENEKFFKFSSMLSYLDSQSGNK